MFRSSGHLYRGVYVVILFELKVQVRESTKASQRSSSWWPLSLKWPVTATSTLDNPVQLTSVGSGNANVGFSLCTTSYYSELCILTVACLDYFKFILHFDIPEALSISLERRLLFELSFSNSSFPNILIRSWHFVNSSKRIKRLINI